MTSNEEGRWSERQAGGTYVRTRAAVAGEEWILLIHPANSTNLAWCDLVDLLPNRMGLIMPDLRGHGRSAREGHLGVASWAADCWSTIERKRLSRVHLVGASVGAAIACALAKEHPEQVSTIATLGGAFLPAPDDDSDLGFDPRSTRDQLHQSLVDEAVAPQASKRVRDRALLGASDNTPDEVRDIWQAALATDVRSFVDRIAAPAMVIVGGQDSTCPPAESKWFADKVHGRYVELTSVGHLPMNEAPAETADLITEHILGHLYPWGDEVGGLS